MTNPLLDTTSGLPLFDRIAPEHVAPAVEELLAAANLALETVTAADFPAQWGAIAKVLDVSTERLGMAWGAVSHLNSVADTPELRAAHAEAQTAITASSTARCRGKELRGPSLMRVEISKLVRSKAPKALLICTIMRLCEATNMPV